MENIKSQVVKQIRDSNGNVVQYINGDGDTVGYVGKVNNIDAISEITNNGDGTETINIRPVLNDVSLSGKKRDWRGKKISNHKLELMYRQLSEFDEDYYSRKADRLHDCATYLNFNVIDAHNHLKLKNMNSCRVKLCPVCSWRRTLKIGSHARKIFTYVEEHYSGEYCYLFLTLTVKSVYSDVLQDTITHLLKSFDRLMKRRELKKLLVGWYRGLEVTHDNYEYITNGLFKRKQYYYTSRGLNVGDKNPTFDTYHPHLHVVLLLPRSYLEKQEVKRGYLTNEKWLQLWRECTKDDSITQVDIKQIKPKKKNYNDDNNILHSSGLINAICETSKYSVKSKDYIVDWDLDLSCDIVKTLDNALHHRRLVAFGGLLKEVHKKLNLDDEINGNLVNVEGDEQNSSSLGEVSFFWHVGYQQYIVK